MADTPREAEMHIRPVISGAVLSGLVPAPRIVTYNRWATAVLLTLTILTILASAGTALYLTARLAQTTTPDPAPAVTGCPFPDPTDCGD